MDFIGEDNQNQDLVCIKENKVATIKNFLMEKAFDTEKGVFINIIEFKLL